MKFRVSIQYFLPHRILSHLIARLAKCRCTWFKNLIINWFIKYYQVDMSDAVENDPYQYESFNDFFTRALKPEARPIAKDLNKIICPVDGYVSQIGIIENDQLIQAKGYKFDVKALLSNVMENYFLTFTDGNFINLYLSPNDYHRIHMPCDGKLISMAYIPGKLFSVNPLTVNNVPNLYARNERVVVIFETKFGTMAMILVGAMLVASIVTVWAGEITPTAKKAIQFYDYGDKNIELKRSAEMGRFQFGSTVILLFPKNILQWDEYLHSGDTIKMGQQLGSF
jgi:phosphatidylserine decarboxylase